MKLFYFITIFLTYFNCHSQIKHFVFIGMDRDQLKDTSIWTSPVFDGVQVAYSWRQLEPRKDEYDFSIINEDLALLKKYNKKLFIQFMDASFSVKRKNAPEYLFEDSAYHGGANKQFNFKNDTETEYEEAGWVTRRWDPAVQTRLHKLYIELGNKFDGKIEGINLQETAIDVGKGPLHPPGFTFKRYMEATMENLSALKKAFPKSVVMMYGNFMPGGFLPFNDSVYMKSIYEFAWKNQIATGGPDLFPWKRGQMNNSYGFIRNSYQKVPSALAVQDGNYDYINPRTNEKIKAEEIYNFANDYMHLTYIFWCTEEPFFRLKTLPFLQSSGSKQRVH